MPSTSTAKPLKTWCRLSESNGRPTDYKSVRNGRQINAIAPVFFTEKATSHPCSHRVRRVNFTEGARLLLAGLGLWFAGIVHADELIQVAAVDGVCSVPYRLRAGEELHIHCYTIALIGRPAAIIETGSATTTATLVRSYDQPPGVWVVMRGKGRGTARVTLIPAPREVTP